MKRHRIFWIPILPVLLLGGSWGCGRAKSAREEEAIRRFEKDNDFARDFRKLYPQSVGFFSLFDSEGRTSIWNSKVGLYGRYLLRMRIRLVLGKSGVRPERTSLPEFTLLEVESIVKEKDGAVHYRFRNDSQKDFGELDWNRLVRAGGDLSVIGVDRRPDAEPMPLFEENWKDF